MRTKFPYSLSLSLFLSPELWQFNISKEMRNYDSKRQIASNKKQNQNIDEDTNSFGALNFVRNTILAACFLLPRALHTQNFLPSLRLSLLARKKANYTKKSFTKKKENLYQRKRSCSSLPALIYLFLSFSNGDERIDTDVQSKDLQKSRECVSTA
jgi:hypothetical protein